MSRSTILFLVLMSLHQLVCSQSNSDDYWLNNGFSDGQTVITNAGWFYDDGGDSLYHEGQNWNVTFCSENGNPITLDFSGFRTHFGGTINDGTYGNYDYMTVNYAGIGGYIVYHDDTPEFSFTSPDGCIDIGFISNTDGLVDSGWVAEIFALPPPVNNDPVDAEELVVGNSCSPSFYSNKGAYSTTSLGSPPCKTFFGGDVWYRLVVPPSGVVKIETFPGTLTYAILDIYRSADADITAGERIACVDDGGIMPSITLTSADGIAPGDVLYIRLFGEQAKSGLFGICATDPSAPVTGFNGPGGVGDSASLDFWYKADRGLLSGASAVSGGDPVETWEDQSGNDAHLLQLNSSFQPVYNANVVNGFGTVKFDGLDDIFTRDLGTGDAPLHWFAAGAFDGSQRQTMLSVGDAVFDKTASISRDTDGRYFSFTGAERYGEVLTDRQFYLFNAAHLLDNPFHFLELNGASQSVDAETAPLLSNGVVKVGASWDGSDPFNGTVSELIQFSKSLNSAQEIIINNYLSAKYDIALPIAVDLYDYKNTFYYDVAGIGRVDAGNMHTKAESAGILAISGADDLDDNEFLFFGHDNGDFSAWSPTNIPAGDTNIVRLDRVWRVGLAGPGSPGEVSVSLKKSVLPPLPDGFSAYNILVDNDGDFSSGAITYGPFEIGSELVMNHINLNDGDHIAIAAVRPVVSFVTAADSAFESVNNPQIEVVLNYAISTVVEIDYSVVEATATQGVDFSLLPSTISIDPGNKSGYIIPLIIDDTIPEIPDEFFDIEISTSTPGVTAGGITRFRYTILNDDLAIEVSASDTVIGECVASFSEITVEATGTGPFTYVWTPVTGLNVTDNDTVLANPSVTTTYTVEVTDTYGLSKTEEIEIVVVPAPSAPTITIDGSVSFCSGDSVKLSAPAGYASYLWSTSETADSIYAKTAGDYNVIITDSFGCSSPVSADVIVTVNPLPDQPVITVDGNTELCSGDSVKLSVPAGFSVYMWSTGQTDNEIYVKDAGNYSVSVTNSNGCVSPVSEDISVTVYSLPAAPGVTPDGVIAFCEGDSVELVAEAGYSSYLWSDNSMGTSLKVKTAGEYFVSGTDGNGCKSENSDTVTVTVNPLPDQPEISADGSLFIITGNSVELSGPAAAGYLWTPGGETTQFIDVGTSGSYSLFVENEFGCLSPESEPVEIVVSDFLLPPMVTVSGSLDFCEGGSVMLSGPDGFEQYDWSDGSTGQSISVTGEVEISLVVTNNEGVKSLPSDVLTVVVYELPEIQILDKIEPSCAGFDDGSITVDVLGGLEPYQYSWQGYQESSATLSGIPTGVYTSTVVDENGCSETLDIELDEPDPITVQEVVEPAYCPDFSDGSIELLISGGSPPYSISWSGGGAADYINNLSPGDYSYEVKDGNNCQVAGTIQLGYENEVCFVIPGIITPNDDGYNDTWRIDGLEVYPDVTIEIFDRWGKRVFYSEGYDKEFDGTFNGKELPMESYHYMIDLNNGSERIIGNITIVR